MAITTIDQFIRVVKEMRDLQKKWFSKHSYITPGPEDKHRLELEKMVDRTISERNKKMFEEEMSGQNELF
ncbi:MAG: hypothetical protein MJZ37_00420 [Bacilli bacterium]|nr:hypothetical protein [Bacilli bacterium]